MSIKQQMSKTGDTKHVILAEKKMKKFGLKGQDWTAARYLPDGVFPTQGVQPDFVAIHHTGIYWFAAPYFDRVWSEDKLAFDTKELAIKFAKACGARYSVDE